MKKLYFILPFLMALSFNYTYAEPCPNSGGTTSSGGTKIFFSYTPATSFCVNRPSTIEVNGTSTFTLEIASCSETTSVYNLTSGPAIPSQDFNVTSGFDSSCSYSGGTLPIDDFILKNSLEVMPNPLRSDDVLKLSFASPINASVNIYSITGKKVIQDKINNQINKEIFVDDLSNGLYILDISTENTKIIRKLIVAK